MSSSSGIWGGPKLSRRDLLAAGVAAMAAGGRSGPAAGADAASAPAGKWQVGCYTRPWDAWEYTVAFDGMAEAGYRHAALMTAKPKAGGSPFVLHAGSTVEQAEQVGAEAKKRGLTILNVYAGEPPVAQSREAGMAGLKRMIDVCAACGCGGLMLGGCGDARLLDAYCRTVAECCEYAAGRKVALSVKPHGGQNGTGVQLRGMIQKVNHPNFRVWYDPGNIYYYSDGKLDPLDDAPSLDGLIAGMSVKDFKRPKDVNVTPGQGLVRWAELLARFRKGGFAAGPLAVECTARGKTPAEVTAQARQAREFLEGLLRA